MKKKYFYRGVGAGVIFATIIMLVAYMTSGGYKMSDEQVIKKAESLGMVKKEAIASSTQEIDTEADLISKVDASVSDDSKETTEKTTEETTEETTEVTTEEPKDTESASDSNEKVTITVSGGMSSETISALLEDAGVIKSATKFNEFLVQKGYDKSLETGTFHVKSGMSDEEVAKILTTKQ
ncbi:MAG: hypothetical protein ACI4EK_07230 [Wujia sp.]